MSDIVTVYEPDHPPAIRLTSVDFGYPHRNKPATEQGPLVLKNLSLAIPPGSITAILGPNGVGKTTLLNLILGWLQPRAGNVTLFGQDTSTATRREMGRTLALVPQDEHIPFEYTMRDYVLLGRAPYLGPLQAPGAEDITIAESALETVGLRHLADRSVAETSGGEKQLAMVARALAQEPRVLLMDEPTAHLDLRNRRRAVDLIRRHRREGVTVVLTTHDAEFAAAAADRMILLSSGILVAEGPVTDVMTGENLSRVFSIDLEVQEIGGRAIVIW